MDDLSLAYLLHTAVTVSGMNREGHPLVLGLWRLWCDMAAWWWRVGVRLPDDAYRPHPLIRAVEDYGLHPDRKLADFLKAYGLESLKDEARRYIREVKTARSRLPHVNAPERLPTFPGGKIPLDRRFGLQRALDNLGGEKGFLEYVRVWAFLISDWRSGLPFPAPELRVIDASVAMPRFTPLRMRVWAFVDPTSHAPWVLFSPPAPKGLAALLFLAQAPGKHPWPHTPQVWTAHEDGRMEPASLTTEAGHYAAWLAAYGQAVTRREHPPTPRGALEGRCASCPFVHVCYVDASEPVPQLREKMYA